MAPLTQQMGHLSLGSAGTVRETCMRLTERLFDSLYFCLRGKKIIKICLFWFVNSLIFHFLAVYGSQYSYARSIYPTVSASADSHCSCGSMCSNKIAASLLAKYFAPPPKKKNWVITLSFRKTVDSHMWTHPAIIPPIPINKPSSAEVTFGQQPTQQCLQTQRTLRIFHCFAQMFKVILFRVSFSERTPKFIKGFKVYLKKFYFHTRMFIFY